ncbi:FimV-like protein [Paraburkholderia unamae]|uniref:FimV/HubP family polar landmark protein n=1 Tax=Paraburkholderia unamae TaxID=219649 RepID=UPI000DC48450|nr:FimV/HubP family polar landmark protein [Paraburkholderia unamae]RAR68266.1 FimV-like protein [Paraburkholderia unamae]
MRAVVAATSLVFCSLAAAQGGAGGTSGAAAAAGASGAQAAAAASAPVSIIGHYTVRPGQSLHDVAVDVTQSHDKATLARMSQALFDANPDAFMKHDPSRMRVGAALGVPATPDVSSAAAGMTAASGAVAAASTATAPAAPAVAASASTPVSAAAPVSAPAAASSAAAQAVSAASTAAAVASVAAAGASAAQAAVAGASTVAASGPEAAVQSASGASAATAGASAPTAAASASDSHVWSGAIQTAPAASGATATAPAQGATTAPAPVSVSSLQQLLALKNRVLMALQQHGIGKSAQPAQQAQSAAGANGASAGAPAAQGGAPVQSGAGHAGATGGQVELTPVSIGVVAAVVVVLLALLVRLLTRKRRKPAEQAPAEATPEPTPVAPVIPAAPVTPAVSVTPAAPVAAAAVAAAAALPEVSPALREPIARAEAQPGVSEAAPEKDAVTITPVPTPVVTSEPLERDETPDHATESASRAAADALPPTLSEPLQPAAPQEAQEPQELQEPPFAQEHHASHDELPRGVEPGEPQTLADATDAASLAAAAELGAAALPPESLTTPRSAEDAEVLARTLEEPAHVAAPATPDLALDFGGDAAREEHEAHEVHEAPTLHAQQETEALQRPSALPNEPETPAVPVEDMNYAEVPTEFPKDAVHALGDIDMALPPRVVEPGEPVVPTAPLSTEPVATPEASARFSSPFYEPPEPLAGEAIEAGTAGVGALAGLAAPRFGALTLDFDLNLPPDSAEPLPVFTPEQLARIARNKLDLAHEYIALGDVAGARSLINEVIESNDHATRGDAQALLSTLAPLS